MLGSLPAGSISDSPPKPDFLLAREFEGAQRPSSNSTARQARVSWAHISGNKLATRLFHLIILPACLGGYWGEMGL